MTSPVDYCDECRHWHTGSCDPNDLTEDGWRQYKAAKIMTFRSSDSETSLTEEGQQ